MEANESFYQMSTPIGMKKRRISGSTMPGRFSMIPVMEQSFIKDSDFEVNESQDIPFTCQTYSQYVHTYMYMYAGLERSTLVLVLKYT